MKRLSAIFLLLLLSPVLLALYLLGLFIYNKPFFIQSRLGLNEREFKILKFRSFPKGSLKPNYYGLIIRKLSLDELPQLINIIKGEMNFVGPRPLLPEYKPHYSMDHRKRHLVKPGITGWAQVKGRNSLTWEEQFELDLWYIKNQNFLLDLKIIGLSFLGSKLNNHKIRSSFKGYD